MDKLNDMLTGFAVVVTNDDLLQIEEAVVNEEWLDLRTANNAARCGVLDSYIAWFGRFGNPPGFSQRSHKDGVMIATARTGLCG